MPLPIAVLPIHDPAVAQRVLALQRLAYAVEARFLGVASLPPIDDTPADLVAGGEVFLGEPTPDGGLAGVLAYSVAGDAVEIGRLMVDPGCFRRGVATRLLHHLEACLPWRTLTVSTGTANHPALTLYARFGFRPVASRVVSGGISLTTLSKRRDGL